MITRPTLLLDTKKCKSNIARMAERARKYDVVLRPHFKTHQSLEIGRWFKEVGVSKITVSSLSMADYFSEEWNDITVAFPVNILEIKTINRLAKKIKLNVLVASTETVKFLSQNLERPVNFFIKINIGNNRTGLFPDQHSQINAIVQSAEGSVLNFMGFLSHAGQTYNCRNKAEIIQVHQDAKQKLVNLKKEYKPDYPNLMVSYGDTPSCSVAEDFEGIDEIRPGNFVFYDLMQVQIGACSYEHIAVAMACPIVAIHKERNEIVIYGGGVHFSADRLDDLEKGKVYGQVVKKKGDGWGEIVPGMYLRSLSQEHGVVVVPKSEIDHYQIGDLLYVLPVHSCMTADVMKHFCDLDGDRIKMMNMNC